MFVYQFNLMATVVMLAVMSQLRDSPTVSPATQQWRIVSGGVGLGLIVFSWALLIFNYAYAIVFSHVLAHGANMYIYLALGMLFALLGLLTGVFSVGVACQRNIVFAAIILCEWGREAASRSQTRKYLDTVVACSLLICAALIARYFYSIKVKAKASHI